MRAYSGALLLIALLGTAESQARPVRRRPTPPAVHAIPTSGDLAYVDLYELVRRASIKPRDTFTPEPAFDQYVGRRVSFSVGVAHEPTDWSARWSYDPRREVLKLEMTTRSATLGAPVMGQGSSVVGITIVDDYRRVGRAVGQNAFGVRVPYEIGAGTQVLVGSFDSIRPWAGTEWRTISGESPMKPDEARRETASLIARVEGVVTSRGGEPIAQCGRDESEATINNPYAQSTVTCGVSVKFDHLEFRGTSGRVLFEWPGADAGPAATNPSPAKVITNPDWIRGPSGGDVERYYPERAQRLRISGRAVITCTATDKGTVEGCSVSSEDPADQGFGDAALKLSRLFRMKPVTRDGTPVAGGLVRIPIRFELPH